MKLSFRNLLLTGLLGLQPLNVYAENGYGLSSFNLDCVINPSKVSDLGVKVPGLIEAVLVDRSDIVEEGQVLAKLDSDVESAALELAQERYKASNTEIQLQKASIALADRQYKRSLDAYRGDALSKHDLDVSETELQLAKIQLLQARSKRSLEAKEVKKAKMMMERKATRAPYSGVIIERFKSEGEYVSGEPLLRIASLNPLFVEVILASDFMDDVQEGMTAKVWSRADPNQQWQAKVVRVDKTIDAASSTFGVRLELPNNKYAIPAGMQCQINFDKAQNLPKNTKK